MAIGSSMFVMAQTAANPFDVLPIETTQHIASYLDVDLDVCNFRRICRSTHDAVDGDNCSFWRRRFLTTFEKPTWSDRKRSNLNLRYRSEYHERRRTLLRGAEYAKALRHDQSEVKKAHRSLVVLRDLILELQDSFSEKIDGRDDYIYESKNLEIIWHFIINWQLLSVVFLPTPQPKRGQELYCLPKGLLHTIQVLLAPALLSSEINIAPDADVFCYPESQENVYGTAVAYPIFGGVNNLDIQMEWVLHNLNFWKYHMLRQSENTLYLAFSELEKHEKPRFWSKQLKQGANTLGKHWKGAYAYVEEGDLQSIRDKEGYTQPINDEFSGDSGHGSFQDMRLEFVSDQDVLWPPLFEQHLHSLTKPTSKAKTRAQHRCSSPEGLSDFKNLNFQFHGEGHDTTEDFCAQGWLNALPPQEDVPGWQRMTMMKYFEDPDTGEVEQNALWAYEGVVMPGGQIMLGRWWSPNYDDAENMYSGPFILWCVDGPQYADSEAGGEVDEDQLP